MAEIQPPRIEPSSDRDPEPQDLPAPKPRAKAVAAGKPATPSIPRLSAPGEDEQHELDEMA